MKKTKYINDVYAIEQMNLYNKLTKMNECTIINNDTLMGY